MWGLSPVAIQPARDRVALLPVGLLLVALGWDASGLDMAVMAALGDTSGFALRHHPWLEGVLHDRLRQALVLGLALATLSAIVPWGPLKRLTARQRWAAISGALLALAAVNLMKRVSLTSCPWDLQAFGGTARYVSHWIWATPDGGPGRCFPGGHASAGFAFWALVWPWLDSPRPAQRRWGRWAAAGVLILGSGMGWVQTLRGAHYPSHTLWSAVVAAALTWGWHRLLTRSAPEPAPAHRVQPGCSGVFLEQVK